MNKDHMLPFRVSVQNTGGFKGFATFRGANVHAREAARTGTAGDVTILTRKGKILATATPGINGVVWTDHMDGLNPPYKLMK